MLAGTPRMDLVLLSCVGVSSFFLSFSFSFAFFSSFLSFFSSASFFFYPFAFGILLAFTPLDGESGCPDAPASLVGAF